jgi:hypothetical protein
VLLVLLLLLLKALLSQQPTLRHTSKSSDLTLQHCGWHWRVCVGGDVGAVGGQVGCPNDVEQA